MTPIGALAYGGSESRRQPSALGTASTNMNKSSISVMAPMMSPSCLASIDDASYSERLLLRRWSTNLSQDRFSEGGSWQRKELEPRNYHRPKSTPSTDDCSRPKVIGAPSLANSWPVDSGSVWRTDCTLPTVNFGGSNTENLRSILEEEMIQ